MRILINKCYDIIAKNKRHGTDSDLEEVHKIQTVDKYESDSIVSKILNEIDVDLKEITVLYYYDGFSVKEISEIIDIPILWINLKMI